MLANAQERPGGFVNDSAAAARLADTKERGCSDGQSLRVAAG